MMLAWFPEGRKEEHKRANLSRWTSPPRAFAHFPEESLFQSVSAFCYQCRESRTDLFTLSRSLFLALKWNFHSPGSYRVRYRLHKRDENCAFYMSKSQKRINEKTAFSQVTIYILYTYAYVYLYVFKAYNLKTMIPRYITWNRGVFKLYASQVSLRISQEDP